MNPLSFFYLTEVKNQGPVMAAANALLTPLRYLFGGRTIEVIDIPEDPKNHTPPLSTAHHVASFHPYGENNKCSTRPELHSSSMSMKRTAVAIALLIPAFIVGTIVKMIACALKPSLYHFIRTEVNDGRLPLDVTDNKQRADYQEIAEILLGKSINQFHEFAELGPEWLWKSRALNVRLIGSRAEPVNDEATLERALEQEPADQPIDVLIVCGSENLLIRSAQKIFELNPMKVVLLKGWILKEYDLDNAMKASGKWRSRQAPSAMNAVTTDNPTRSWFPCKQWHMVYEV